jgi:hypothetical protein
MMTLTPKPGFDWRRVQWSGPDDPRSDACSYCAAAIPDDACPLQMWTPSGHAAMFCDACAGKWWGFEVL